MFQEKKLKKSQIKGKSSERESTKCKQKVVTTTSEKKVKKTAELAENFIKNCERRVDIWCGLNTSNEN